MALSLRFLPTRRGPADAPASAPRFVQRVVAIAFVTVVGVLAAISAVLVLETRAVVERGVTSDLAAAQRQLAASQRDRQRDALLRASLISSSPTLNTVVESYQEQRAFGTEAIARRELGTLQQEIGRIAPLLRSDALALVGLDGRVIVSAGSNAGSWRPGTSVLGVADIQAIASDQVIEAGGETYRATIAPVAAVDGVHLAYLVEARRLDARYAAELAGEARSEIAILVDDRLVARTRPVRRLPALSDQLRQRISRRAPAPFRQAASVTATCSCSASVRPPSTPSRPLPRRVTAPPRPPCRG